MKIVAFDEDDATLAGHQEGTVHGTVVQNPYMYGFKSVEVLAELAKGDESVHSRGEVHRNPRAQIRKDNVEEFWADLKKMQEAGKCGSRGDARA